MRRVWITLGFASLALVALGVSQRRADACVRLGHTGEAPIRVDFEEALIVYDTAHQMEHFIRSASFLGVENDFGFVVPTPNQPTMTEVDEAVFTTLAEIYRAPEPPPSRGAGQGDGSRGVPRGLHASAVEVVATQHVAGMDATVLRATDAAALTAWLTTHGLATPPGMTEWLAPYVRDRWYLTAFQYRAASGAHELKSRAVRMSFTASTPFFPYSEPSSQPQTPGRRFRLTIVSDTRMDGYVGPLMWSARVGFAGRTAQAERILGPRIPDGAWTPNSWFTTFDEVNSIRGSSDLFFGPSHTPIEVAPSIRTDRTAGASTHLSPQRIR